jgi:ETFB lysine methyltransferase
VSPGRAPRAPSARIEGHGTGHEAAREAQIARLEQSLLQRFRTTTTTLTIAGRAIEILHPANADDLIDPKAFDRDERLPYWADLWPSGRVLGESLLAEKGTGRRLIELGCGAGLVAVCAAFAGYEVTATDYYDDALEFTRVNVFRNTGRTVATRMVDWRALPTDLARFDRVIGSDLLYEMSYAPLIAQAIRATLASGGTATIADPGRVGREKFLEDAVALGLVFDSREDVPFVDGVIRQTVALLSARGHRP